MDNTNITPDGITVRAGQVWEDLDKRENGRRVTVISVADGKATVQSGPRKSTISIQRMRERSGGWRLVSEAR